MYIYVYIIIYIYVRETIEPLLLPQRAMPGMDRDRDIYVYLCISIYFCISG